MCFLLRQIHCPLVGERRGQEGEEVPPEARERGDGPEEGLLPRPRAPGEVLHFRLGSRQAAPAEEGGGGRRRGQPKEEGALQGLRGLPGRRLPEVRLLPGHDKVRRAGQDEADVRKGESKICSEKEFFNHSIFLFFRGDASTHSCRCAPSAPSASWTGGTTSPRLRPRSRTAPTRPRTSSSARSA